MLIFYKEVSLEEGFKILSNPKGQRIVNGKDVSAPSGLRLFSHLYNSNSKMVCWCCGLEANIFVLNKGKNDVVSKPVLDLFSKAGQEYILMTRDHIIPKSFGGVDDNSNLRIGCGPCNHTRGNEMADEDIAFMKKHPELIKDRPGKTNLTLETFRTEVSVLNEEALKEKKRLKNRARNVKRRIRNKEKRLQL